MDNILKDTPQVWLAREITSSQGVLLLTQMRFPQSTGGQQEAKYKNLADTPGARQVQRAVRI